MAFTHKNVSFILFVVFAFVLISNYNVGVDAENEKEIPMTKFGQNVGPTLTFKYCYSCGYRKAFQDYAIIVNEKYPQIQTINGANYDPPGFNMYLSKGVFVVKMLLILIIISSFDLFGAFGTPTPSWWRYLLENKLYACMMVFFLGNTLESQLVTSGAFEIFLNDVPVWSKLQTGRIPAPQELFQIIDSHLQFTAKIQDNPDFVK